ncbi:hypothetical protein THII_1680 [Thioploca ingrica]|uniref:ParE-like toxin domain-containing protein n=1 Tax=Thioploca ingrica TaxID=40754 RepID=A0A090AK31_9GAMM|nr:hypothetical protein THII_1680 [Thioploca ingrica]
MISHTTEPFRKSFADLPKLIQQQAKTVYKQFIKDPYHPSLQFKRIHSTKPIYSVRINLDYRAIGILQENEIIWFWIGSHNCYEKLIQRR